MNYFFSRKRAKEKTVLIISIFGILMLLISSSYAILLNFDKTDNVAIFNVGNLKMSVTNNQNDLILTELNDKFPENDENGLSNANPITLTFTNTGTVYIMKYNVKLVSEKNTENISTLNENYIRYAISEDGINYNTPNTLVTNNNIIFIGKNISVGESKTIYLKIWIDEKAGNDALNKSYFGSIDIELFQEEVTLDKSGANKPEMIDNMIPVYYEKTSDTTGVWKKADSKNLNQDYQWYDYETQIWANSVTVKDNGAMTREEYLKAPLGTEIKMDDITAMWVWIPRYKYVIFNENFVNTDKQNITIIFENGTRTTGTVSCTDNILTSNNSNTSQICVDNINGTIKNGISTYTHPAFTFNNEELTGFWINKFELSSDNTSCINNQNANSCNLTNLNLYSKPNQVSLRYIELAKLFANIRKMEIYNNIHGFSQTNIATTWLDNNNQLTGDIKNDANNFDIHIMKNIDWGAMVYLSHSKFGKFGNKLYEDEYKEIYVNNNCIDTSPIVYKTGYSSGSFEAICSTTNTYLYNDLRILIDGQGYIGAGSSSTGNIYGIYDLNGGSDEFVMASIVDTNGNLNISKASSDSSWSTSILPLPKYYDLYSYYSYNEASDRYTVNSQKRSKLGDGIKECIKTFGIINGSWYNDRSVVPAGETHPWFVRGGRIKDSINGTFSADYGDGSTQVYRTSRAIIIKNKN